MSEGKKPKVSIYSTEDIQLMSPNTNNFIGAFEVQHDRLDKVQAVTHERIKPKTQRNRIFYTLVSSHSPWSPRTSCRPSSFSRGAAGGLSRPIVEEENTWALPEAAGVRGANLVARRTAAEGLSSKYTVFKPKYSNVNTPSRRSAGSEAWM